MEIRRRRKKNPLGLNIAESIVCVTAAMVYPTAEKEPLQQNVLVT